MKRPVHLVLQLAIGEGVRIACDESEAPILWMLADGRGGIRTDSKLFATDAHEVTCEQCKARFQLLMEGKA